ncbi:MAG: phosphoribosylglycinamide formyltransferase [Gammaproteobacteria bacterium]|nr:MAG: phosphoribosylglycinamide formyltransferase [Gammaproteobacteria bacterium]
MAKNVSPKKVSLVVLISGDGSNLQAIIDAINHHQLDAEIKTVISNRPEAPGLRRAIKDNITTHVINHKEYPTRQAFDQAMIKIIDPLKPDLIILAGFMRILSEHFIDHYQNRLINIHPSLLPKYKGLNTHQQALDNKDITHGSSVHFVSHELDSGPVVIQAKIDIHHTDNAKDLAARVLEIEHKIYPLTIQLFAQNRIKFNGNQVLFDNKPLKKPLLWKNEQITNNN